MSTDGGSSSGEVTRGHDLYDFGVTDLTPNTQYWFEVWALNDDGAWSATSSGWESATTATSTLPAPTITTVGNNPPSFTIDLGSYGSSACTFWIEKSYTADGFEFYESVECVMDENGVVGATYTDWWTSGLAGRRYYYRVYAVTNDGIAGELSNVLEIVT